MMLTILLTFVLTLLSVLAGYALHAWVIRHRTAPEVAKQGRVCGSCGCLMHPAALKQADGSWRCARCKGLAA